MTITGTRIPRQVRAGRRITMDEITATAASGRSRGRRPRRLHRLVLAMAAAAGTIVIGAGTIVLGAGTASADSWSPWFPPQAYYGYFGGDCTIHSGPIYDPLYQQSPSPHGFAVVGGGYLSCLTPHTYQMWVQEYFSSTGAPVSYYQRGTTGYYSAANDGAFVESGRACGTGYWFTRVTISAFGYTPATYFDSTPQYVSANGRSATYC